MIDTIIFNTRDYLIKDDKNLTKMSKVKDNLKIGYYFYYNDDTINLRVDQRGLIIKSTMSRLYGLKDFNFYHLGFNSFKAGIDHLKLRLKDLGVLTDLESAKIWRLDIFRNILTDKDYEAYKDVFNSLTLSRLKSKDYPDGYSLKNGLREILFYNKLKELRLKKITDWQLETIGITGDKVIRGEVRLLNHKEVIKNGLDDLNKLSDRWGDIREVHRVYMREVFKYDFKESKGIPQDILGPLINFIKDELKRGEDVKIYGSYFLSYIPRQELKEILEVRYSKRQVFRRLSEIDKLRLNHKSKEFIRLYEELKNKFIEDKKRRGKR